MFEKRLCPSTKDYSVKNLRGMDDMIDFRVNIEKCNTRINPNCKVVTDEEFDEIMKKMYFTVNYLQESAELNNYELDERPTVV